MFVRCCTLLVLFALSPLVRAESPKVSPGYETFVRPFLAKHCLDCHGEDLQEADLRLDKLPAAFTEDAHTARWLKVVTKLRAGEMPPKGQPRPLHSDLDRVTAWIQQNLVVANAYRQKSEGRVVLRRLNRVEYQNTIRDLFAVDVDVKDLLPEDSTAHGFDNIGEALNISSVLMERYLEAADVALDQAIQTGPRPATTKKRFTYKDERRVKDHKSYKSVKDALVFYSAGYSPTEILQFRAPTAGNYRVRVSAYAYQSTQPVTFRVYGGVDRVRHLVGYFQAKQSPTVVESVTRLGHRNTVRVVPYGTVLSKWNQADRETGPGLAVQWVEVEGPLLDRWPPESHRRVFGDLPIRQINIDEIRRNRRLQPLFEVVSENPEADAKRILARLLPKVFRRPVEEKELQPYLGIIRAQLDKGYTFQNAIRVGLKAALCSPAFLYLSERLAPGLGDYQIANRLSYFLWSTMPDDSLFDLASQGKLQDPEVLRQQTERMLQSPRAKAFTENFVGQWLDLREIDFTTPDTMLYPEFDELLQISMVRETQLFFEELLKHDASVLGFIDSDFSMLNERLARHYGIEGIRGLAFRKVLLPKTSHRGGVLTHASVLKVTANGTNTSPVLRGVWVLDKILGQPAPPPPANVPAVEPDIRGATSIREQLVKHRTIESCASCHKKIDPPGFALENFDVIGGWRETYRSLGAGKRVNREVNGRGVRYKQGLPVEAGASLANGKQFRDIGEFKQLLLEDKEQIVRCLAEKLLTYATGSGIQLADRAEVDAIVHRLESKNYGLRSLVHEVVQSKIFRRK